MANITRVASASIDVSTGQFAPQLSGNLLAGEALSPVAPCYIKASDGRVYMSNATSANEAAKFDGFTAKTTKIGESVTLFGVGARFRYGSGLTEGTSLYIADTAGLLSDTPTVGCPNPIARVVGTTDIRVLVNADRTPDVFVSTELTGTGSAQNVAHGFGSVPTKIFIAPTDLTPATVGQYVVTEGAHTATNVVVTVTTGKKFKVLAFK